jgi:hypothetical protein
MDHTTLCGLVRSRVYDRNATWLDKELNVWENIMTPGGWFWIFYILWLIGYGWWGGSTYRGNWGFWGGGILLAILLFLLGYKTFGSPLQ